MKITKRELKQMINESVKEVLNEHGRGARFRDRTPDRFEDPLEVKSLDYKEKLQYRNKLKMLCQELKDIFPTNIFYLNMNKKTLPKYYYKQYRWGILVKEYDKQHPLKFLQNAVKRTETLHIENNDFGDGWYICGYLSNLSLEELEQIINRC